MLPGVRSTGTCISAAALAAALAACAWEAAGAEWAGARKLDRAIESAIQEGLTPGAVAWIESRGEQLHFARYGARSIEPQREPMELDTMFDCASLTKVMVTAPAVMMLVEEGKVRLNDRVQSYLPEFEAEQRINVLQLLTHFSGLRPSLTLDPPWAGYEVGVRLALKEQPTVAPGSKFVYSDINYILLGEIVRRTSGMPLDEFAKRRIFEPLGMRDTMYLPPAGLRERIAPTEVLEDGTVLRGVVHDPTTRMMGGVAGHAGVFSTAGDVALFARMMLNGGRVNGEQILSPLGVRRMRTSQSPPGKAARGIGWDIDTPYSSPRGDLFGTSSYGHTGFTGPSLWIDPASHSFVALMTNRVHPTATTSVVRLRSFVASITAANLGPDAAPAPGLASAADPSRAVSAVVRTGLDVLADEGFASLAGKRIGLLTNRTGVDRRGRRNVDLFAGADAVQLEMVLTPEHGLTADLDQADVPDGTDGATGVPVVSLYRADRKRPEVERIKELDALIFDIQDIGTRFYTYITTMGYAMEAAAQAGIEFFVLDRPNPITGAVVEGPMLDDGMQSFVGYHSLPVRHGMTVGELAKMFNDERGIGADLKVVEMRGWERSLWFDETGLPWVNPSPNIRSLEQAILYPGIAMLEFMPDYSVGRGTDEPFRFIGAPWVDGPQLADQLRSAMLPGIRVYPRQVRPRSSVFSGELIPGVHFTIVDRDRLQTSRLGIEIAAVLSRLYPQHVDVRKSARLIGSESTIDALENGADTAQIWARIQGSLAAFRSRRRSYLIY